MALVKYNNNSISAITAAAGIASGGLNLITTNTISSGVSSSSFTSNINSTYDTYMFKFFNIHPSASAGDFQFNGSTDSGSNYNITKTTTTFEAGHSEGDSFALVQYNTATDLAQSTGYAELATDLGSSNDHGVSGTLYLFSPSNTTFVKHFIGILNHTHSSNASYNEFMGGYFNTTSAIDAIDFKMSTGNIDSGVIKMYGLSKS